VVSRQWSVGRSKAVKTMWTMKDHRRAIRLGARANNKTATAKELIDLARLDGRFRAYCSELVNPTAGLSAPPESRLVGTTDGNSRRIV
jgi:hypothetical protein